MRKIFYKMHGIGNDYVYFDCFHQPFDAPEKTAVFLCDRHRSIGGDGIILMEKSGVADAKMRIFNADGSEGKMCGNGIRCMAKYLFDSGRVPRKEMTIETLSGVKRVWIETGGDGKVFRVTADMGRANFSPSAIPVRLACDSAVNQAIHVGGGDYVVTCVSMGNPHCVIFSPPPEPFPEIGGDFNRSPLFPEGVNVEFAQKTGEQTLRARVWERGSGETLACGTGACAVASAAVVNGLCREGEPVTVRLRGGALLVTYTAARVLMTGEAALAYVGRVEV